MNLIRLPLTLLCLAQLALVSACNAADPAKLDHPIRVACVGDSITEGVGTLHRETGSYPAQLQSLLGPKWEVHNFGVSGRTMLRKADAFDHRSALEWAPEIVIIALGTNDSKTPIWAAHQSEFVGDYIAMIKAFQALPSHPQIWACLPPPAFPGNWGINEDTIRDAVIPGIQQAIAATGIKVIDLHTPLLTSSSLFPDTVHPNDAGTKRIAELVAAALAPR